MNVAVLVERRARARPDSPALIAADGATVAWTRLQHRIGVAAQQLRDCGIGPGDRVALIAANGPDFAVTVLAAAGMGAILVPLNWRLGTAEIGEQLADSGSALLLYDAAHAMAAETSAASANCRTARLEDLGDENARARSEPVAVEPDHPLGIFYTGGTTGRAKGVVLTHGNLLANARNVAAHVRYGNNDVHLHVMPMFHLGDLGAFFCQLFQGGAHVFLAQFRPDAVLDCIERRRVTSFMLAPSAIPALFADETIDRRDLASWRFLWYGDSPITETALRRALALFRGEIVQGYGQTEATHTISVMSADDHRLALSHPEMLASCGRPVTGVDVRLVDDADRPVASGEIGEIAVRGATVMKEYWRRPGETADALRGGWLHTGDLARRDEGGRLYIVDRKKDMIVSGAENVFSAEVENALGTHPAVAECAVFAVPDVRFGEGVHAAIVLRPGASADGPALAAHCRTRTAAYKVPRSFEFHAALPKTAFGKVQKAALREPHWRGRARRVG